MKAFLSSTFKDLEPYRAAVIVRLRRLDGVEVRCMEDFGARAGSPKEFCLREARECDLFIGVIGHLYGFVPEGDETSITEQEYQAAEEAGRDRLLFVAPDTLPVPVKLLRGDSDPEKQEEFRARVLGQDVVNLDWSSPETLAAGVVEAVYNWRLRREGGAAAASVAVPGIDSVVYAQRCRRRWEAVDLSTLAAPGALDGDVELPKLSQVFIPQDCRRSRPAVSLPRDYLEKQGLDPDEEERLLNELRERWERQERLPALDLLARSDARRLVLLGDPGAGKSSLTRYVLLRLLDPSIRPDTADDWRRALDGTWPVLVELRDLLAREAEGRCGDLVSYLAYVGETQGFGFDRAALEAQLRDRPSMLIVDGLDEIFSPSRRRAVVEEIVGLETRFPDLRVLVTSRIAGFDARPFEAAGFAIATLDDLNGDQIRVFAENWFTLAFPAEPEKAQRARDDLLEALQRRPQLAAIAGNPLILTIMAIIARHKRLARSRTQLYAQALEVLCYAWDYRRGLALPPGSPLADLQPEDTLLMLRRIAWRMQESDAGLRANAISEADLKEILFEFFENEWHFPPPKARAAASEMVKLLQERNWILTTRGPDLYGFVHRTFLEYLCALELTKRFEAQELSLETLRDAYVMPRVDDDSYSEVIRLLSGQLPPRVADQLILAICPTPERVIEDEDQLILAWQTLGELEPRGLAHAVAACDVTLLALYKWLQSHLLLVHYRSLVEAINSIEPGSWPASTSDEIPFPFFDGPFQFASDAINQALARAIWLPSEDLRHRLFSLAESTVRTDKRGAVAAMGGEMSNDPQVFRILRKRASEDDDDRVRAAAIRALVSGFVAWPETFDLVRHSADEDNSGNVRAAAVYELISGFADRPGTFDLARKWVKEDANERVRRVAVEALIESFADLPEAASLIREVAEDDVSSEVRCAAILQWSVRLNSNLSEILLTRDLDQSYPGIDPHEVIDPVRVAHAAERLGESPETIRDEYEKLVREHGFPLRLSWLEDETDGDTVSP
ncbi:MAG TPA: DUF4062 domain-containing protein [Longimicrobiaceae bacterium]|nr:DUF4062 domain-containing protein [Longimicrobiaceae bacterium]